MKRDQDWDSMKHTAFSYSFTPKEFYFFLFKKPKCRTAGRKCSARKNTSRPEGRYPHIYAGDGKCKYEEG